MREAEATAAAGELAAAQHLVDVAAEMAPGLPEVHDTRARLFLKRLPFSIHTWLPHQIEAYKARLSDFQRRMLLVSDAVLLLMALLAGLGLIFLVAQLFRYGLHVYHDLGAVFPSMAKWVVLSGGVVLALFPFIFGFGPLLLFLPVAGLVWAYQSVGERVVLVLFVLLFGASPWLLRMADHLSEAGTGLDQAIYALDLNPHDHRAAASVEAVVAQDAKDMLAKASLGLALKRRGELDRSQKLLSEAVRSLEADGARGAVANNLGNLHFAAGRPEAAKAAYEQAIKLLPQAVEPVFNLHRLVTRTGDEEQAQKLIAQASSLGAAEVTRWDAVRDPHLNRYVVDMPLPSNVLTLRALSDIFGSTNFARRAWVVLAGPVPEMAAPVGAGALLVVFVGVFALRKRLRLSWPCTRCGRVSEVHVVEGRPNRPLCEQCVNLFVRNIPVDRRIRFAKEEAIGRYQATTRWGTRLAGVLFPGFAALVLGRTVRGVFAVGLTLFCLLGLALPHGVLFEPVTSPRVTGLGTYAAFALLGLLWLRSVWSAHRWTRS